jgi:SNF family Na+-dependent transporter
MEKEYEKKIEEKVTKIAEKYAGRVIGNLVSIVVMLFVAYLVNKHWERFDFLNSNFFTVLWVYNISIAVNIVSNLVQAISSNYRINRSMHLLENIFSIAVMYNVYRIFPFNVTDSVATWIKIITIAIIVAVSIASLVELTRVITGKDLKENNC